MEFQKLVNWTWRSMPMIQSLDFGELCITQHSGVITIITLPSAQHMPPVTPHRPGNGDAGKNVSSYQVSSHSDQDNLMALIHLDTMLSETSCWCRPSLWWPLPTIGKVYFFYTMLSWGPSPGRASLYLAIWYPGFSGHLQVDMSQSDVLISLLWPGTRT